MLTIFRRAADGVKAPECHAMKHAGALCVVCGEPAEYSCDSRLPITERLNLKLVHRNDLLILGRDGLRKAPRYLVTGVDLISSYDRRNFRWRGYSYGWLQLSRDGACGFVKKRASAILRIERLHRCANPVCFRHVRELAKDYHLCLNCIRQTEPRELYR